ncbi:MAG: hypothetical protein MI861_27465, partial [Pirellulales bacterium]|nr:hypothetical protein [Pirellulales bacterium]
MADPIEFGQVSDLSYLDRCRLRWAGEDFCHQAIWAGELGWRFGLAIWAGDLGWRFGLAIW